MTSPQRAALCTFWAVGLAVLLGAAIASAPDRATAHGTMPGMGPTDEEAAAGSAQEAIQLLDEAARPCPPGVAVNGPQRAMWCGRDPANVVAVEDGVPQLTIFREHYDVNIAAMPTPDSRDLDWTCIEGACGGLLDPGFIVGRPLSHLWRPAPGEPELVIGPQQWQRAVRGRNTWLLWAGGNQGFWDHLARHGYGLADFLKLLDNRLIPRADRLRQLGVINEPGMAPAPPGEERYGLRLDVPVGWDGPWPPEPGTPLPKETPDPEVYGYSSGVMGMRLFPNPAFFHGEGAAAAQDAWDAERFLSDPLYAKDPALIRPYRVGVACGFCHVSFNPINPPADPSEPEWKNISATVGAQYLKFGRVAAYDLRQTNVLWQLVNFGRPGTVDTSLVATDGINNPNTANGIHGLPGRVVNSLNFTETANERAAIQPVLDLSVLGLGLPALPSGEERRVMRVLAGGEDSVGGRLALARVYLNIGTFHEYWGRTANMLVGVRKQTPMRLDVLRDNSVYWNVSLYRSQNVGEYLSYVSGPLKLADAPGGEAFLSGDPQRVARGREHFVTHCMACHSSKQPGMFRADPANWQRWVRDPQYLAAARTMAARDDFLSGNFLATDVRYPVTDIGLNISRFLSDNGRSGRVWADFTSHEYKNQPVLSDELALAHPYDSSRTIAYRFHERAGPARTRPLTLINMWSSAPFLHNNMVGQYPAGADPADYPAAEAADVSVAGRMAVFTDAVEQLLHLRERRGYDSIIRTSVDTRLEIPRPVMIDFIRQQLGPTQLAVVVSGLAVAAILGLALIAVGLRRLPRGGLSRILGAFGVLAGFFLIVASAHLAFTEEHRLGRIPAGTPVNLIVNLNGPGWIADSGKSHLLFDVAFDLGKVWLFNLPSLDHERVPDLVDNLIALSKAPDLVLDRGHDFGGKDIHAEDGALILPSLGVAERRDLIEYLKTL